MSNYELALAKQIAERMVHKRYKKRVQSHVEAFAYFNQPEMDPFTRERLAREILREMADDLEKLVERVAAEAVRRAEKETG